MGFNQEDKINFIFEVVVELAKKQNCIPLDKYYMAKFDISDDDFSRAVDSLDEIDKKSAEGIAIGYMEFESALRKAGFDKSVAKCIIGILYANSQFTDIIDSWENPPIEIKSFIKTTKKYEKHYNLNDID